MTLLPSELIAVLVFVVLLAGCTPDTVTPADLEKAKAMCDSHGGVAEYYLPKPVDVYCTDKFHVRVFPND